MLAMLGSLIGPVSDLLDKAIPDKDLKEKLAHDIATMAERHTNEQVKAQLEINKVEAKHNSMFELLWLMKWAIPQAKASHLIWVRLVVEC